MAVVRGTYAAVQIAGAASAPTDGVRGRVAAALNTNGKNIFARFFL